MLITFPMANKINDTLSFISGNLNWFPIRFQRKVAFTFKNCRWANNMVTMKYWLLICIEGLAILIFLRKFSLPNPGYLWNSYFLYRLPFSFFQELPAFFSYSYHSATGRTLCFLFSYHFSTTFLQNPAILHIFETLNSIAKFVTKSNPPTWSSTKRALKKEIRNEIFHMNVYLYVIEKAEEFYYNEIGENQTGESIGVCKCGGGKYKYNICKSETHG